MAMKYVAAYLMAALAGNESPSADDIKKILASVESDYDEAIASKLVSELAGKTIHEVVKEGKEKIKSFGGGGGAPAAGGAGGAAPAAGAAKEAAKVVVEEEEEEDVDLTFSAELGGSLALFGSALATGFVWCCAHTSSCGGLQDVDIW
eukprot:CAMPEP_0115080180 /NCGR_PEP_ID=MMETSP0227-20121206/18533_1 /TAXON_ID=89957 /ORGANISM="Polarella glacialis, Strain CCMP 1383" /LENGTH=147 /DNA_ID=CAMNT_0002467791 /DNA_START=144 /DNA_END=585 /DNA_ORIENTATION=+